MPTPFPGMDPYLERRDHWHAVHTRLLVAIADALGPQVGPHYRVDIELRTYIALLTSASLAGIPDVLVVSSPHEVERPMTPGPAIGTAPQVVEVPMPEEIHERYLVVYEVTTQEVVTVIEILSLANKLTHEGREAYEAKRTSVLGSKTNLVEIDLVRAGRPLPPFQAGQSAYRILISPAPTRPRAMAYMLRVRNPLPTIPIPLQPGDPEPALALNQLLHDLYERARYDLAIDYSKPPVPPLPDDDVDWVRNCCLGSELLIVAAVPWQSPHNARAQPLHHQRKLPVLQQGFEIGLAVHPYMRGEYPFITAYPWNAGGASPHA